MEPEELLLNNCPVCHAKKSKPCGWYAFDMWVHIGRIYHLYPSDPFSTGEIRI